MWLEILNCSLNIVLLGVLLFYKIHIEESVKTLHKREQSYEKEKGRYDALQESVNTILSEVEHMKSGVAFEEQRRHHWIESRNQKLINLITYSEIIRLGSSKFICAINNQSKSELEKLQDDINNAILNSRVDLIALKSTNPEIHDEVISTFVEAINDQGGDLLFRVTSAIGYFEAHFRLQNLALSTSDKQEKEEYLKGALNYKKEYDKLIEEVLNDHNNSIEETQSKYIDFLTKLFEDGLVLKN
jgi:cell division protein FtsB